ncbi:aldehyde dehydrogenase [Maribacter sp. ACAM166]|uniref:aldehyde dehydrogenase n=1 Tax=Maribacter sp. ACAM166 TaxID=2508996 RepID=UPI0010FE6C24|nr:aldehyde dehydrogenase [Maribacter sp. ACAM166]TLP81755.1 aldehyde dehydrogenase [Maribacter sp. ACAM166]
MESLIDLQRTFFSSNATKDIQFRIGQLKKLKKILKANEDRLHEAIYADFKKSAFENSMSELAPLYQEINEACKKVEKWAKTKKVKTNVANFPASSYVIPEPLGVVLVIGAWNYPYLLSLAPVISAIAAGNTVVLKPSELPANTSYIMAELINENFDASFFKVIEGGIPETTELLEQEFDKIFFTGSPKVGKIVYRAAAKNLTPVTLELGGKSPAIFSENCNLKMGVKRLIWSKFLNAGQICIAPDYVLVHKSRKSEFLKSALAEIEKSDFSIENGNYVQIINKRNTERLINLLDTDKIYYGGDYNLENRYIAPTLMTEISFEDEIMEEEIFGPILPIIEYDDLDNVISQIKTRPKPLACYVFSNDKPTTNKILREISFGGGAVNDALMHFSNNNLPFGGVGQSGMGAYHGKFGFRTFSHYKSILDKPTGFELNLKYSPHTKSKEKWITRMLK